jgi:ArsR family transcriptional regulator, virulence genes transcriptional regulator
MTRNNMSPAELAKRAGAASRLLKALSHEARLLVLCQINDGERSAGELQRGSGLSQSALSQHLAKLREEGLVATRREAQTIYYSIADAKAAALIAALAKIFCPPPRKGKSS